MLCGGHTFSATVLTHAWPTFVLPLVAPGGEGEGAGGQGLGGRGGEGREGREGGREGGDPRRTLWGQLRTGYSWGCCRLEWGIGGLGEWREGGVRGLGVLW